MLVDHLFSIRPPSVVNQPAPRKRVTVKPKLAEINASMEPRNEVTNISLNSLKSITNK